MVCERSVSTDSACSFAVIGGRFRTAGDRRGLLLRALGGASGSSTLGCGASGSGASPSPPSCAARPGAAAAGAAALGSVACCAGGAALLSACAVEAATSRGVGTLRTGGCRAVGPGDGEGGGGPRGGGCAGPRGVGRGQPRACRRRHGGRSRGRCCVLRWSCWAEGCCCGRCRCALAAWGGSCRPLNVPPPAVVVLLGRLTGGLPVLWVRWEARVAGRRTWTRQRASMAANKEAAATAGPGQGGCGVGGGGV